MLIMALAHARFSGDGSLLQKHVCVSLCMSNPVTDTGNAVRSSKQVGKFPDEQFTYTGC